MYAAESEGKGVCVCARVISDNAFFWGGVSNRGYFSLLLSILLLSEGAGYLPERGCAGVIQCAGERERVLGEQLDSFVVCFS